MSAGIIPCSPAHVPPAPAPGSLLLSPSPVATEPQGGLAHQPPADMVSEEVSTEGQLGWGGTRLERGEAVPGSHWHVALGRHAFHDDATLWIHFGEPGHLHCCDCRRPFMGIDISCWISSVL